MHVDSDKKYWGLLISLFSIYMVAPFFQVSGERNLIAETLLIMVLLFSIWSINQSRGMLLLGILIATPLILASFLSDNMGTSQLYDVSRVSSGIAFSSYVISLMCREVFFAKEVNSSIIVGAICIYMLCGLGWSFVYGLLETLFPSSFSQADPEQDITIRFIYFSMVTQTTVGYGDVTPITPIARSFATMQAVVGQIYLTVLVAKLVGVYSSKR